MSTPRSRSPLSVQVAGALLCWSAWAQAQTTAEPQALETVVVTGVRASLGKAIDAKRGAESVTESVVAEDLAAFPDQNIGMALQRLTGVSTTRSSGGKSEGSGVRVRGLSTAFTQSTINGVTLVSPEQGREADFSLFPSDLFSKVEVNKTATPDQTEGGLSGTVNLFTLRPLDITGFRTVASVKGNGTKDRGAIDPELNLLISNSNGNKTFGALLAVSSSKYFQRSDLSQGFGFISTPLDTDRNGSKETTALLPQLPRNGVQTFQRDRKALVAAVQLRPADNIRLSAEAMKARVHEDRFRYTIDGFPLLNGAANVPTPTSVTIENGVAVRATIPGVDQRSENLHQVTTNELSFYNLDGSIDLGQGWLVSGKLALSEAARHLHDATYVFSSNGNFSYDLGGDPNYVRFGNPDNPGLHTEASQFVANQFRYNKQDTRDREPTLRFEVERALVAGWISKVELGAQSSNRKKDFEDNNSRGLPAIYVGRSLATVGELLPFSGVLMGAPAGSPRSWVIADFDRADAAFDASLVPLTKIFSNTFGVREKVSSVYARADLNAELGGRNISGNVGVRYVKTDQTSDGFALVGTTQTPITLQRSYSDVLPSLNLRAELTPTLVGRIALSKTMTRPTLTDISPRQSISNATLGIVSVGNPDLQPFRSSNFDASLEWYYATESLLSFAVFNKDVKSFIVDESSAGIYHGPLITDTGPLEGRTVTINRRVNGTGGTARGFEVGFQQPFKTLGGWLRDFGIATNFSYTQSRAPLQVGGEIRIAELPGSARTTFNLIPYYEAGGMSLRLAFAHRSRIISSIANNQVIYSDALLFVDLSAKYEVNKNLSLTFEIANLTGQGEYTYSEQRDRNIAHFDDKPSYKFGARFTF